MGQFKCFVKGNYFYLVDLTTTIEYEGLRKDVFIRRHTDSSDKFFFSGVNQAPPDYEGGIHIDDILDENGTPYGSVSAFMDWYQANTGNFNGGGNTPTSTLKYDFSFKTSGNDEPDVLVLNTQDSDFLGSVQWSKVADGVYQGVLFDSFSVNKTFCAQLPLFLEDSRTLIPVYNRENLLLCYITMYWKDSSTLELMTFNDRLGLTNFIDLGCDSVFFQIYVG